MSRPSRTVAARRRGSPKRGSASIALAILLGLTGAASAAPQAIPLEAGTYCGPGDSKVVVDLAEDTVAIEGYVCSFPVIAADRIQSDLCSDPQGQTSSQMFDMHVVGSSFTHAGSWYRPCPKTVR